MVAKFRNSSGFKKFWASYMWQFSNPLFNSKIALCISFDIFSTLSKSKVNFLFLEDMSMLNHRQSGGLYSCSMLKHKIMQLPHAAAAYGCNTHAFR